MHDQPMAAPARTPSQQHTRRGRGRKPSPLKQVAGPQPSLDERLERAQEAIVVGELVDWRGRPRSPATVAAHHEGCTPWNAGRRFPAEVLTPEEIKAILDAFSEGSSGIRNRAVVVMMWRAGLRIGEVLALYPKDVDAAVGTVTILRGKGAKRRVVGIDTSALDYLASWLRRRAKLGVDDTSPIFCAITQGSIGRPLTYSNFRGSLATAAKRSGVRKRVHPHGFRHTHAFELAMEGVPVQIIQAQLGHESLEMTQHYIDHLAPVAVVRALQGREWPSEILPLPAGPPPAAALCAGAQPETRSPSPPPDVLAGDPRAPEPHPARGTEAAHHPAGLEVPAGAQRVLDVLVANHGQATTPQIAEALGIRSASVHRHCARLYGLRLIVRAGRVRARNGRGQRAIAWRLAPPPARFIPLPDDQRVASVLHARSGQGAQRVLDVLTALGGSATQVQLAHELGLHTTTVANHCKMLEARGIVTDGGSGKVRDGRGVGHWSRVWKLKAPAGPAVTWTAAGAGIRPLTFTLSRVAPRVK